MYVITGATGNIGSKLTEILLSNGKSVRMISRNSDKMKPFVEKGADDFEGDILNTEFLTKAFQGAEAVFAMEPPDMTAENARRYTNAIGESIATAIKNAGVKYVVNLSSVGAHLEKGAGIVQGLRDQEERLNKLERVNVLHLRPAFFMENILGMMPMIKQDKIMASTISGDKKFPMVATQDIAQVAAERMINLDFEGKQVRYILGERDVSYNEVTEILGKELGMADLRYVQVPEEQVRSHLRQWGVSESVSDEYMELMEGIENGLINEDAKRTNETASATRIEDFARVFANIYTKTG